MTSHCLVDSGCVEIKIPAQARLERGTLESRDWVRLGHPPSFVSDARLVSDILRVKESENLVACGTRELLGR